MLKLNKKLILVCCSSLLLSISCRENSKDLTNGTCGIFVAGKEGFWLDIQSDDVRADDISFYFKNKKITPHNREIGDTLLLKYRKKDYKIYDFVNSKKTAIDGTNHERIIVCRVATAKLTGLKSRMSITIF